MGEISDLVMRERRREHYRERVREKRMEIGDQAYDAALDAALHKPIDQLNDDERDLIFAHEEARLGERSRAAAAPAKARSWADPQTPANAETAAKIQVDVALSRIVTAQTILSTEYPEPRWAVKGLVPEGVTFAAGAPKLGKSIFVLGLGVAVAEGGKALSHFDVEQGSVLYLALEDGERRIQERLRKLTNGRISDKLQVVTEWPRLNQGGLEAIDAWIERHKDARLLIVDTLKMLRPLPTGRDRNAYDADYETIQPLTKVASQRVALLIVHHTRKAIADDPLATVSGSYGLTGAADGVLVLSRRRNSSAATLSVIGRDVEEQELALEFKPDMCLWSVLGKSEEIKRSSERQEVLDLLAETGELMTPANIAELLGKAPGTIRFLLYRMKNAEEVKLFGTRYQLPKFQPPEPTKIRKSKKGKNVSDVSADEDAANAGMFNQDKELEAKRLRVSDDDENAKSTKSQNSDSTANALTDSTQTLQANEIDPLATKNVSANVTNISTFRKSNGGPSSKPINGSDVEVF